MLYHFSEEPDIGVFVPRSPLHRPEEPPMVWAIDEFHAPHYYFPRDCPRVCIWPSESTTVQDHERFFGQSETNRVIAVETGWLERIRKAKLYRYSFHEPNFTLQDANAGYYTCNHAVEPSAVEPMGDLLNLLSRTRIEFRITPSLQPLRAAVLASTVNFSMIRMKNAK